MKTIVGIDFEGHYESALRLLSRVEFSSNHVELVHADEPLVTYVPAVPVPFEIDDNRRIQSLDLLERANHKASAMGLHVTDRRYMIDPPTKALLDEAAAQHDDLIAIGSRQKGKYGSLFLGSVGRALAIGSRSSVLVAKGEISPTGEVTAVFATDQSEYANEALRLLLRMHPKGIGRLVLVTAIPEGDNAETERQSRADASQKLVDQVNSFDLAAEYRIVEGTPESVIAATMKDVHADLLILGAQGHGFLDRLFLGSLSLQQVVASPFSTLLLRPR